jgi:hypothetical protein
MSKSLLITLATARRKPMPLNIGANGSVSPYVKFNAKADKWFAKGENGDVEIARPTFIADLPNIATGWLRFLEGQAPERVMDNSLDRAAPNPGNGFKRGFVLAVYSQNFFGGLAGLSSASIHMGNAMREIYSTFEAESGSHPGQVPVIACTGSEPMKDRYGTNYRPKLEIVKWVDRPAELPDQSPVEPSEVWQGAPVATAQPQAVHVPPPQSAARATTDPLIEAEF